jgi:hypothetical protein
MKSNIHQLFLFLLVINFLIVSCKAQPDAPLNGGVYVSELLIKNRNLPFDSIYPIVALRIDSIIKDTILIKYVIGPDGVSDIDYGYDSNCKCYQSKQKLILTPWGNLKEFVDISILDSDNIELFYFENNVKMSYLYKLTYIDNVDLSTHRNIYFIEEGF